MCSLMYMSIRTLDYVIFSHQANLSKTTKHWDGFVSHCTLQTWAFELLTNNYIIQKQPSSNMEGQAINPHLHHGFKACQGFCP